MGLPKDPGNTLDVKKWLAHSCKKSVLHWCSHRHLQSKNEAVTKEPSTRGSFHNRISDVKETKGNSILGILVKTSPAHGAMTRVLNKGPFGQQQFMHKDSLRNEQNINKGGPAQGPP